MCAWLPECVCVQALTLRVSFVLHNLSCSSSFGSHSPGQVPASSRVARLHSGPIPAMSFAPLRKLLFCLMICAQSRNWGRRGRGEALVLDPQWMKIWKTIETTIFCCRLCSIFTLLLLLALIHAAQRRVKKNSKIQRAKREGKEENRKRENMKIPIYKFCNCQSSRKFIVNWFSRSSATLKRMLENQIKIKNR